MTTEVLPPQGDDILLTVFEQPSLALLDKDKADSFIAAVINETKAVAEEDASTTKGRAEIRAMATKVTRSKTMLDKARLDMTANLRKQVSEINEAGFALVERLAKIAEDVKKPVTEWEAIEDAREKRVDAHFAELKAAMVVTITDTSDTVRERGERAFHLEITREEFGKRYLEAKELRDTAVEVLKEAMIGLERQEAERAELAKLRKEAEEREARDRAEREEREAEERRRLADEEAKRIEAEALERVRQQEEQAAQAEAERVKKAAEQAAEAAQREAVAAAQREIDEANARAAEAERALQEKRDQEAAEQAEQERRERNKRHRAQIMGEIKISIMAAGGITEDQAVAIVKAAAAGNIARLKVEF